MEANKVIDATGLACPMPIVRTKRAMDNVETGEILEVHATDQGFKADLAAWSKVGGHEVLESVEENGVLKFWVKKG